MYFVMGIQPFKLINAEERNRGERQKGKRETESGEEESQMATLGYLAVLGYDAHPEVQRHVDEEQRVGEDVEALPAQAVHPVQEGDLHGDANQVQERDGHHAHDVVAPGHTKDHALLHDVHGRNGMFWDFTYV